MGAASLLLAYRVSLAAEPAGFEPLFNGKDLSGWVQEGPAGFVAKDGMIVCTGKGNYPAWLRTEEVFENFVLRLEYKTFYGAESGIFFHAPLHGRLSRVGFEVQICNNTGKPRAHSPGAIFSAVPPLREAARHYREKEFNAVEIRMEWPTLRVTLNGQVVQNLNVEEHEALRHRLRVGYIGLQPRGKRVQFRKLEIRRLPDRIRSEWKPLFDGRTFDGWTVSDRNSAKWRVENGEIVGEKGHGYLITDGQYRNCEFQVYIKSSPLANGGIFFRWKAEGNRGFEIQIEDIPDSNDPTGSIYGRIRAAEQPFHPGQWTLMQVYLKDRHCRVRLNGVTVAETHDIRPDRPGHITLQMHTGRGWIRFEDPRVRPLDE